MRFLRTLRRNKSYSNPAIKAFLRGYLGCYRADLREARIHIDIPRIPRKGSITKVHKFLTKQDIDTILSTIKHKQLKVMIRIYFETGLRASEVLNLKLSDINLLERRIKGVGKRDIPFDEPISKTTCAWISSWLGMCKHPEYPFRFWKRTREEEIKNQSFALWYRMRKECEKIGFPGVHPHRLRHSLGYYLRADMGFDLSEIKEKLHHKDISTTQIYSPATKEVVDEKIRREVFEE